MKQWFLKNLGDAMLAGDQQGRIKELLSPAFSDAGSPAEMAAFIRHESEGRLHCEVKIYLSPMLMRWRKQWMQRRARSRLQSD